MNKKSAILMSLALACSSMQAQVKMLPLFTDNMVLQQRTDAPIWGETSPGKTVEITTSWNKKTYTAKADSQGRWKTSVATPKAGGPYTVTISDGTPVKLNNVMIGEVWLCSGQSNMEMQVEGWGKVLNYEQEKAEANRYPDIRLLHIEKAIAPSPQDDIKATADGWQVCSGKTVADFSATAYFFGRDLNKYRNVPVGLIDTSWGGTIIETWTSRESLEGVPSMKKRLEQVATMPATEQERRAKYEAEIKLWEVNVNKADKGMAGEKPLWASPDFEDSAWQEMKVPAIVQDHGIQDSNGLLWYRRTVDIPASWAGKELTLDLGLIDDNDVTFFNGEQIGSTVGCFFSRSYKVPAELVKEGKAVIAVRVTDTGGLAGINGEEANTVLKLSDSDKISVAGNWKFNMSCHLRDLDPVPADLSNTPNCPTLLYNAMLRPLVPYAIKGAIWYQGEANADAAYEYRDLMPLMIADWRKQWGYDFPFYMVQLANFMAPQTAPEESAWAELREAQARTLHLDNTGMAVIIDIGEANDIHPKNKQEVGHRLALAARARTYGEKISYSGPMYEKYSIEDGKIRLYFSHTDKGLKTNDGGKLRGFTIAGVDHKFYWADAKIEGNTIVVSAPEVALPVAVRYAWANNPECNLYNGAGLPASPFRTDDWKGLTDKSK